MHDRLDSGTIRLGSYQIAYHSDPNSRLEGNSVIAYHSIAPDDQNQYHVVLLEIVPASEKIAYWRDRLDRFFATRTGSLLPADLLRRLHSYIAVAGGEDLGAVDGFVVGLDLENNGVRVWRAGYVPPAVECITESTWQFLPSSWGPRLGKPGTGDLIDGGFPSSPALTFLRNEKLSIFTRGVGDTFRGQVDYVRFRHARTGGLFDTLNDVSHTASSREVNDAIVQGLDQFVAPQGHQFDLGVITIWRRP